MLFFFFFFFSFKFFYSMLYITFEHFASYKRSGNCLNACSSTVCRKKSPMVYKLIETFILGWKFFINFMHTVFSRQKIQWGLNTVCIISPNSQSFFKIYFLLVQSSLKWISVKTWWVIKDHAFQNWHTQKSRRAQFPKTKLILCWKHGVNKIK